MDFNLLEEIEKLEKSERRDLNIVALLFRERKPDIRNKLQYQAMLSRHLKPAKTLKVFDDDQILEAIKKAKEFVPGWTLETIIKILTK